MGDYRKRTAALLLLMPLAVLASHRGSTGSEIAAWCDVPLALIELRWMIWRKFGR